MTWFSIKDKTASMTEALSMYKEARAPRNYKQEYAQYHSKPQRVAERSQRNKARRKLGLAKGDPREVDHKNPISNGGSNARSNLRAVSLQANRRKFTKTANTKHHLITGVPGAGKSTVAKRIAKEKGLPLFEIDSDPRFQRALQLVDEGKIDESNALQRQMFRDAVSRKDPHVIEGAQVMLDPTLAKQHELQILDDSADVLAPRWAKRETSKHKNRALKSGRKPYKDEAYYDKLYRGTVYPRYQKQLEGLRKTATISPPPIDNYTGRWTTVGSGRLGIAKPGVSDVDYMVPVEDLPSTEGFSPFQQYTSAYKRNFDMPGYRGGSIVALPEGPYKTIDDSYATAIKKYTPKQLKSMKEAKGKLDFYRDIGVVLTDDAMRHHNKTANDRERTYAEMRDAIRGFAAKQKIDPEKAMLVAGGAGYMHGMRDEVNDLDFFHDDLPDFVQEPYGRFDMDGGPGKDLPPAAKQYQMMHGMRVQTPESMLAFYQRLNRPKDQEKITMLKEHLKMANDNIKHTIITGHSGSGKSTLSRKLAKETGLPIYAMDDDPGIRDAFFNYQKTYAKTNDGRLDLSATRRALEDEIERRGIEKALKLKTPHIIEGSHFLRRKPEEFRDHKLIMVNPSAEAIAFQRTNRKKLKDLARGREWNPEIERQSRFRGQQLYDMYEAEGRADNWRNSSLVEKRAMLTPASALRMMKSNNKIVKGLGRLGSKIQIAATKPGVNKVVQSMADGAYGGTGFGVASGVGEALRQGSSTLKNSRLQNALELAGIADIAENHGTAITPLGHAYSYLMDSLPTAAEGISNLIG